MKFRYTEQRRSAIFSAFTSSNFEVRWSRGFICSLGILETNMARSVLIGPKFIILFFPSFKMNSPLFPLTFCLSKQTNSPLFPLHIHTLKYIIAKCSASRTLHSKTRGQIVENVGWTSADRSARLLSVLTVPSSVFKSYAKDLCFLIGEIMIRHSSRCHFRTTRKQMPLYDLGWHHKGATYCYASAIGKPKASSRSSMDSGLEAFSRYPTHGSFSALTCRSTEFTKYATQRFLSY